MRRDWRLRRRADFQRLRLSGRTVRVPTLVLSLIGNGSERNRYGVIVSKQIGGAVVRNRVRRRLREVLRMLHPHLKPGFDMALIARAGIVERPYAELQRTVIELTRRAGLLQESTL
ncbi:MAG: ribonuclease P protein component [Anaerolineae bacterium]|nr:ribonuclease P protein component [Anaerolineae bacterium]